MRSSEINLTLSIYQEKGVWGYSLPELGLNFGNCKNRNQAICHAATRIVQCCTSCGGPEDDESREPQNEDPDLYGKYSEEVYCRAAGAERGE